MEDNLKVGILTVGSPKRRDNDSEYGNDITTVVQSRLGQGTNKAKVRPEDIEKLENQCQKLIF